MISSLLNNTHIIKSKQLCHFIHSEGPLELGANLRNEGGYLKNLVSVVALFNFVTSILPNVISRSVLCDEKSLELGV